MSETPDTFRQDPAAPGTTAEPAADASSVSWRRNPRQFRWAIAIGVAVLGVALWLVTLIPGWMSRDVTAPAATPAADAASARRIQATLYHVAEDGTELVPFTREVAFGATPAEQARHIVASQIQPFTDNRVSPIPAGVTVRSVFVGTRGDVYVDLSPEIATAHRGGSLNEALTVFAIVNAITVNVPAVTSVQILVDGKEVDSLAGHIDLREPIARSDAWIRKGQ